MINSSYSLSLSCFFKLWAAVDEASGHDTLEDTSRVLLLPDKGAAASCLLASAVWFAQASCTPAHHSSKELRVVGVAPS